jgi:hypothetical protein
MDVKYGPWLKRYGYVFNAAEEQFEEDVWTNNWARGLKNQINQELKELYKTLDLEANMRKILEWLGHVIITDQTISAKTILANKSDDIKKSNSYGWNM